MLLKHVWPDDAFLQFNLEAVPDDVDQSLNLFSIVLFIRSTGISTPHPWNLVIRTGVAVMESATRNVTDL
jgi:hypothetical protein